jgi:class 3 adenylate cyclase
MNWGVSDRRRLTMWLCVVLLGGLAGYIYVLAIYPAEGPAAVEPIKGFRTGMMIAGLAVGFELYGMRTAVGRWLRRLSFAPAFLVREGILALIIVASLVLNSAGSRWLEGQRPIFAYPWHDLVIDTVFSFAVCGMILFVIQARRLIGARTLNNILLGRYHQPVREQRLFTIFDLEGSTRIAATIGDERFHALLSEIFAEADREIVDHGGEVHSFVGDAIFATWPLGDAVRNTRAVAAVFAVLDGVSRAARSYRKRFGVAPRFRAALHGGPVVAGECGDSKRQITYLGDVLNVTARLEQLAKTIDTDVIISADLLPLVALPANVEAIDRGEHALKGIPRVLQVFTLARGGSSVADKLSAPFSRDLKEMQRAGA